MCGIVGQFVFDNKSIGPYESVIQSLNKTMSFRGPDREGFWTDSNRCAFGFRRLAILDLTPSGDQPMLTPDEKYALVFNGEIYNYKEIRSNLEQVGIRFRSSGDSEVVLYALSYWGVKALTLFNGMFALAFFDILEQKLLLARDHAGIKPLYYLLTDYGIVFASQYDQLLQHPWIKQREISKPALSLYLQLGYIPSPYGLIESTYTVQPGCWLEIDAAKRLVKGCHYEMPRWQKADLTGREALEALDGELNNAVRRHLISDVPVGVFLSGGIDSPLVAAKMRGLSNKKYQAFTIATSDCRYDESNKAQQYAEELNFTHIVRKFNPDDILTLLDSVVAACSEPFADISIFPTMMVSQVAQQHVKVVLSGDGGDELFWGYVQRMVPVFEQANNFGHPRLKQYLSYGLRRVFHIGNGRQNILHDNIGDWYLSKHTHLNTFTYPVFENLSTPEDFQYFTYSGSDIDVTAQWLRWNEYNCHLPGVLLKVDRASMYHSLEVRVPLLDKEVLQTALRIDWQLCLDLKKRIGKIPLRLLLAQEGLTPSDNKMGFSVPMDAWLRNELRPVFEELVVNAKEIIGLPINHMAVIKMYNEHFKVGRNRATSLWTLLSLALWEQKHLRNSQIKNL